MNLPTGYRRAMADYGIVVIFAILFVSLSLSTETFLTQQNLVNLLDQVAIVGILASAATLCIIAGVFDLSMSAVLALSAIAAVAIAGQAGTVAGCVGGVLVGTLLGAVNGLVGHYGRINSFIATLATSIVFRGLAIVITGGLIVKTEADGFGILGQKSGVLEITWAGWLFAAVAVATGFLLSKTTYGRALYAVGGNPEAARLSGIRIGMVRTTVFMISGALAAMAGLVSASRTGSAQAAMGLGLELTAIAAAVVGGTSILGGEGAIWRGMMGVLILALIGNGLNLLAIDSTYQQVVQGLLILLAVGVDQILRRRY